MDAQGGTTIRPGMEVRAVDGDSLGRIVEVRPDHVVVEKGTFFPEDHYIPLDAIGSVGEDGAVHLLVSRDEAVSQEWQNPPASLVGGTSPGLSDESYDPTYDRQGDLSPAGREAVAEATGAAKAEVGPSDDPAGRTGGGVGTAGGDAAGASDRGATGGLMAFANAAAPAATAGITGTTDDAAATALASVPGYTGETATDVAELEHRDVAGDRAAGSGDVGSEGLSAGITAGDDVIRIPVHEEELVPVKREVPLGAVRIEKEIVTTERTITVPVTEERLRITRLAPSDGSGTDDAFAEEVIEIPIRGETVEVVKRPRVANEVVVEKERVERTEHLAGTVRREELRFEEEVREPDPAPRSDAEPGPSADR